MEYQSKDSELRVITHGNNGIKSSQLFNQLQVPLNNDVYETASNKFHFFPCDLDVNRRIPLFKPHDEMNIFNKESPILVLISQTEIFSEGMHSLILRLPHNNFYGFNANNENEWWKRVVVVFWFGEYEGGEEKIQQSIAGNGGIKDIVEKAGNRYIWASNNISIEQFEDLLHRKLEQPKEKEKICLTGCLVQMIYKHSTSIIIFLIISIIILALLIVAIIGLIGVVANKPLQ